MTKSGMSSKFWYLASFVILGALALGAQLVWNNFAQYASNETNLRNIRQFHSALLVMSRISAERGPANSAMTEAGGAEPFAQALQTSRTGVDDALNTLSSRIDGDEYPQSETSRLRLNAVRERLAFARRRVDAVVDVARPDRSAAELQGAIESMFGVVDTTEVLVDDIGGRTTQADPAMSHTVIVASLVTELRDIAGRLGSQFIVPLQTQQAPSADRLAEIIRLRARIEQMRTIIAANIGTYMDDQGVARAWEAVNTRYFDHAFKLLDGLKLGQPDAIPYPMTPAEFTARLVPEMTTLQALRDVIIDVTYDRAIAARDRAWRVTLISAMVTGILILAMICIIIGMQRFLFQPLLYIRDQIMALALGNAGEVRVPSAGSEEIREVLTALRLLRESQRARLLIERERNELNQRLKTLAETDPLTGLLNRRALDNAIKTQSSHLTGFDGSMGLILLDLDRFKAVNDVHGHVAGDGVLRETARRICQCVRSVDLVARFGGEEFAIVIAQPTMEILHAIAESIRSAVADMPIDIGSDCRLSITASLGVALGRGGEDGWKLMLTNADQALYRAKDEGRNRVVVARRGSKARAAAA
jgi:diguanylate cyclase (GGDEF)-like protein